jgi:hypothetical protein
METAMNEFKKSVLWPVDCFMFTGGDFASSMATDQPTIIQLEKPTANGIENFNLSYKHAVK